MFHEQVLPTDQELGHMTARKQNGVNFIIRSAICSLVFTQTSPSSPTNGFRRHSGELLDTSCPNCKALTSAG